MARAAIVDIFCEDARQELLSRALVERAANEEGVRVAVEVRAGRGGVGRAVTEFDAYQRLRRAVPGVPDLLVVMVDADAERWQDTKRTLSARVDDAVFRESIIAVPDRMIEDWYLMDPAAVRAVGGNPDLDYESAKVGLPRVFSGLTLIQDGLELGREIVNNLDTYQAGRNSPSFNDAWDELTGALRRIRRQIEAERGGQPV